ncbi:MAG: hypothetical protein K9W44_09425 [Candidatus Lokiarchaeota archaeon]|nr:hypothetical protein [Candidatus Harpocratesius repetitus]
MENLQNLLKLKETEIEKLNDIKKTLKRKVIELNDKISLKEMKISTLSKENQEIKEKVNSLESEIQKTKEDLKKLSSIKSLNEQEITKELGNGSTVPSTSVELEKLIQSLHEKIDFLNSTFIQKINVIEKKIEKLNQSFSVNSKITDDSKSFEKDDLKDLRSSAPPSSIGKDLESSKFTRNYRKNLKPSSYKSERGYEKKPSTLKKQVYSNSRDNLKPIKKKIIAPIVNAEKINQIVNQKPNLEAEQKNISSQLQPSIPDEYTKPEGPSPTISQNRTLHSNVQASIDAGSHYSAKMGKYGVPTIPYPENGFIKCPKCGGNNFQEMENKKKIVMYNPRKYGKKYYCKDCRTEWDYEY